MSSKKKSTTKYNQTQVAAPPSFTAGGLEATAGMVQSALGQIPTQHYDGQQVAFMSPEQLAQIQGAWTNTAGLAGDYTDWMGNQLPGLTQQYDFQTQLPTASYDMGQLTDVQPVIQSALNPVLRQLQEQILPGIQNSSLDAGAYSGDRAMSVLPTTALQNYSREASDIATQIAYQNYQDYEARRLQAWEGDQNRLLAGYGAETQRGLGEEASNVSQMGAINDYISGILRNSASQGDLLNMAAQLGVTNQQAQINDLLAQDQYASYSPFMGLDQASALLAQLSGNYGTQTTEGKSKTTEKTGGLGEWVKGAIGLGSMVAGIPGIGGALGLGGAAAGASGSVSPLAAAASAPMASSIFGGIGPRD
jgi:hypothetical protein